MSSYVKAMHIWVRKRTSVTDLLGNKYTGQNDMPLHIQKSNSSTNILLCPYETNVINFQYFVQGWLKSLKIIIGKHVSLKNFKLKLHAFKVFLSSQYIMLWVK